MSGIGWITVIFCVLHIIHFQKEGIDAKKKGVFPISLLYLCVYIQNIQIYNIYTRGVKNLPRDQRKNCSWHNKLYIDETVVPNICLHSKWMFKYILFHLQYVCLRCLFISNFFFIIFFFFFLIYTLNTNHFLINMKIALSN